MDIENHMVKTSPTDDNIGHDYESMTWEAMTCPLAKHADKFKTVFDEMGGILFQGIAKSHKFHSKETTNIVTRTVIDEVYLQVFDLIREEEER